MSSLNELLVLKKNEGKLLAALQNCSLIDFSGKLLASLEPAVDTLLERRALDLPLERGALDFPLVRRALDFPLERTEERTEERTLNTRLERLLTRKPWTRIGSDPQRFEVVIEKLESLDQDHVNREVMARYLLHHIYDAMTVKDQKGRVYEAFLMSLGKVDCKIACELKREYDQVERAGLSEASQGGEGLTDVAEHSHPRQIDISVEKGIPGSIVNHVFCEEDVAKLTEFLAKASHKSRELGLALGLCFSQISECQRGCSYILGLSNILKEWIASSSEPCTVSRLCKALSSSTVALNKMALDLQQCIKEAQNPVQSSFSSNEMQTIYCSSDTTGAYGKATLLGFLTTAEPVSYQWRKNDQPLSDNDTYSGSQSAFLYIKYICGPTEGYYDCWVRSNSSESNSGRIKLTVYHSEIAKKFLQIYSKKNEIPKDTWPPVANQKFISLALITKNSKVNKYFEYAVLGDMDDIIASKENIKYLEAFRLYKSGTLWLVEGRPGSGKTTLMHNLTRDWAIKKNVLLGAEIVVLVPLRLFCGATDMGITLSDIFENYLEEEHERNEFIASVKKMNGEGICFIIDGLDEYEYRNQHTSLIYKLIYRQVLPLSMVIVASRPVGTASVRNSASVTKRIEVLGFKNDQIIEYVKIYFVGNQDLAHNLQSYLKLHVNVLRMCYLPVHAAMICFLYEKLGDNIPQTETKIYESFTKFTILRYISRDDSRPKIDSLQCLPEHIDGCFAKICSLAFDMIIQSKQVVLQSETQFPLSSPGSDKSSLGLVTIDSTAEIFGMEDLYAFLHLTFQEYLAAFYLSGLDEEQVISKTKGKQANLRMVWKFYCGMVTFKDHSLVLKHIMSKPDIDILYKCQCGFESQQQVVCNSVLECEQTCGLSFKDYNLVPTDFIAISYAISNTSHLITKLTFTDCTMEKEGVNLFIERTRQDCLGSVTCFGYHEENCTYTEKNVLNTLLQGLPNLEILDLGDTMLELEDMDELAQGIKLPKLRHLKLKCILAGGMKCYASKCLHLLKFGSTELKLLLYTSPTAHSYIEQRMVLLMLLAEFSNVACFNCSSQSFFFGNSTLRSMPQHGMEYFQRCSKLALINCDITDDHLEVVIKSMPACPELIALYLDFNKISGKSAKTLSLSKCSKLKIFSAHCNQVDDSGALAIIRVFLESCILKVLDLQGNPITNDGVEALKVACKDFGKKFKLFTFSNCDISTSLVKQDIDFKCEVEQKYGYCISLLYCTHVLNLDLDSYNGFDKVSQVVLADGLKCFSNLQILSLGHNKFDYDDMMALAKGLNYCSNIQSLCLNSIMDSNVILVEVNQFNVNRNRALGALADVLKCCHNLQRLSLSQNSINSDEAKALADGLKNIVNLHELVLASNHIGSEGMVALVKGLTCCIHLESLDLSQNGIDADGVVTLVQGLKCWTKLRCLKLGNNQLGSLGATSLAEGLKDCTDLQILSLRNNSITSDGAIALAEGLKHCAMLQNLDLSNSIGSSSIGSKGAISLADGQEYCTRLQLTKDDRTMLRKLDPSRNNIGSSGIGSDGVVALAEGLKHCTMLQQLDLSGSSIGSDAAMALAKELNGCAELQVLRVRRTGIILSDIKALVEGLKHCTIEFLIR